MLKFYLDYLLLNRYFTTRAIEFSFCDNKIYSLTNLIISKSFNRNHINYHKHLKLEIWLNSIYNDTKITMSVA